MRHKTIALKPVYSHDVVHALAIGFQQQLSLLATHCNKMMCAARQLPNKEIQANHMQAVSLNGKLHDLVLETSEILQINHPQHETVNRLGSRIMALDNEVQILLNQMERLFDTPKEAQPADFQDLNQVHLESFVQNFKAWTLTMEALCLSIMRQLQRTEDNNRAILEFRLFSMEPIELSARPN